MTRPEIGIAARNSVMNEIAADNVYIACGYTDLRRSIDGLTAMVKQMFKLDPCSQSLFLFCGRRSDRLKGLFWEGDGFLLLYKRLECGRFQWPRKESDARRMTTQQLRWLLEGLSIEQPRALRKIESVLVV
ncbi:MAG: IS66 family insertion sequence element accessory protein TnpB [Clostridiales bacterium]|nr:IS66 family insertion sequence element accessory protein TnpB [Clostridiales bacterium]